MSHFQISPPKKPVKSAEEDSGPAHLFLGSFSSAPKLHFGEVPNGSLSKRILYIRNPLPDPCTVKLTKRPSTKLFYVGFDSDVVIPGNNQIEVEFTCKPSVIGTFFESCQFHSTNTSVGLSVKLMGKCIPPKKKRLGGPRSRPLNPALETVQKSSKVTIPHSPTFTKLPNGLQSGSGNVAQASNEVPANVNVNPEILQNPEDVQLETEDPHTPQRDPGLIPLKNPTLAAFESCSFLTPEFPTSLKRPLRSETFTRKDYEKVELRPGTSETSEAFSREDKETLKTEVTATNSPLASRRETYLVAGPTPAKTVEPSGAPKSKALPPVPIFNDFEGQEKAKVNVTFVHERGEPPILASDLVFVNQKMDSLYLEKNAAVLMGQPDFSLSSDEDDESFSDLEEEIPSIEMPDRFAAPVFASQEREPVPTDFTEKLKALIYNEKTPFEVLLAQEPEYRAIEIKSYFEEIKNSNESFRACFNVMLRTFESEEFTMSRLVIREAIKKGDLKIRKEKLFFKAEDRSDTFSELMSYYHLPYLWSAVSLVYDSRVISGDFEALLSYLEMNLFWDDVAAQSYGYDLYQKEGLPRLEEKFLNQVHSNFIQKFLELVYLLDFTRIPGVFFYKIANTREILDSFARRFLEDKILPPVLLGIPINITEPNIVTNYNYFMIHLQDSMDSCHWMNFVHLVQELAGSKLLYECDMENQEECLKVIRMAFREVAKIMDKEIPEDEVPLFFNGSSKFLNEDLIWGLLIRLRIKQIQELM